MVSPPPCLNSQIVTSTILECHQRHACLAGMSPECQHHRESRSHQQCNSRPLWLIYGGNPSMHTQDLVPNMPHLNALALALTLALECTGTGTLWTLRTLAHCAVSDWHCNCCSAVEQQLLKVSLQAKRVSKENMQSHTQEAIH